MPLVWSFTMVSLPERIVIGGKFYTEMSNDIVTRPLGNNNSKGSIPIIVDINGRIASHYYACLTGSAAITTHQTLEERPGKHDLRDEIEALLMSSQRL